MTWTGTISRAQDQWVRMFDRNDPASGVAVTYQAPGSATAVPIRGIWTGEWEGIDLSVGVEIDSINPEFDVKLLEFEAAVGRPPEHAGIVRIGTEGYQIRSLQPDGQGMIRVELQGRPE